ncbi:MAG: outer membrane beta-barrel protein [Ignavibacteriales bacterium]|nr:outer membrane beta-barrel protein [Ignavibacteriales bacterium]
MKKLVPVLMLVLLVAGISFGQEGQMRLGAGLELVLPSGTFGDVAGTGFGGTANFLYTVNPQITITGTAGYIMWGEKSFDLGFGEWKYSYSAIPILAGGRYYFTEGDSRVYGSAEIGLYMFSATVTVPTQSFFGYTIAGGETTESSSEFTIAPGVGYEMKIGDNMNLDVAAKYLIISDMSNINLRAGVNFVIN